MLPTTAASVAMVLRPIWAARTAERDKLEIRRGATIFKALRDEKGKRGGITLSSDGGEKEEKERK